MLRVRREKSYEAKILLPYGKILFFLKENAMETQSNVDATTDAWNSFLDRICG